MNAEPMLSVAEARARVLASVSGDLEVEIVGLAQALGRTLARDLVSKRTQPPQAVSAMDGYAVRAADIARLPARLTLIGESAAGNRFSGRVNALETVRIFTGAPVPDGADAILIQENARADAGIIEPLQHVAEGQHIRGKGLDFTDGEILLRAGARLGPTTIALAAAMNLKEIPVNRRPRVAILATGDELVQPGGALSPDQIVASNAFAIAALVKEAGGEPLDFGIARDNLPALETAIKAAVDANPDILVTVGGASVGDHDLVKPALARAGMKLSFWRVAMRPGKPLIHGSLGRMAVLGLPGNPASAIVGSVLFLAPLVKAFSGDLNAESDQSEPAILGGTVRANDARQDYLRASLEPRAEGLPVATPFSIQDSSLLRQLAEAQCLVIRAPQAPQGAAGDSCRIIRLAQS